MRYLWILVMVASCSQKVPRKPWRPAPPLPLEDVAAWVMRSALAGDDSTARMHTLRFDQIAQISNKAETPEAWETLVKDTLDQLAKEGDGETYDVKARVVEKRVLTPGVDEKVKQETEIALVKITVNDHAGPTWLFIRTDEGWKFSPKN